MNLPEAALFVVGVLLVVFGIMNIPDNNPQLTCCKCQCIEEAKP